MRKKALVFAEIALIAAALSAQVPKSADQVPSYPGAALVSEEQGPTKEEIASGKGPNWIFSLERVTSSTASVEQVAQFYARSLGVAVEQEGGADPNELATGQVSSVGAAVDYWDQGLIDESPDAVRAAFQRRGRLPGADAWARGAAFFWAFKSSEKDPFSFTLTITDKSLPEDDPSRYAQLTEIRLSVRMMNQEKMLAAQADMQKSAQAAVAASPQSDAAAQEAWGLEMQQRQRAVDAEYARLNAEADKVREELTKVPTEKQLGVAIYPGARYDSGLSIDRTMPIRDIFRIYIFEVNAKPDIVAQFYVKRTGHKIATSQENLIYIPINFGKPAQTGDTPPMKDVVIVGGPTDTGSSVIMVRKTIRDSTGQEGAGR